MPLRIYIQPEVRYRKIIRYVFRLIAINKNIEIEFTDVPDPSAISVGSGADPDFFISQKFYEKLAHKVYAYKEHFAERCMITEDGRDDLISTIFYCVNSIQEYNFESEDALGRFMYKDSYQNHFGNVEKNMVQGMIDKIFDHVKLKSVPVGKRKSKIFLTHDIDSIHGSWKEDGFFALRKLKPGKLFGVMLNQALGRPDWLNMDKIMKIEDDHGFRSVFYWLLYRDKKNSDYNFKSRQVQKQVFATGKNGWENGLHKSLRKSGFQEELARMEFPVTGNRYHYLNFTLPTGYEAIEASGLKLDTSLGFYEQYGFRNSYGLPFMPYHLEKDRIFKMMEVPMQVMDRTFFSMRMNVREVEKKLIDWFESNKYDCVFSLNFHNNFFSALKYDGYEKLYKALLSYFMESGFEPATQSGLIDEFYHPEQFNDIAS